MCGIYGIISLDGSGLPGAEILGRMGDVTRHRGPDDHGSFADSSVLLGMRRLSIIDVDGGHQPISNHDKTLWVVCNGEIYNFRELRQELVGNGHRFSTSTDTEVLLHAYAQWGDDFIHHIGGMFGFAIWDARRRRLVVGRDRLGIKPLYYCVDGNRLAFASEIKALLELPGFEAALDPDGLEQYLSLGYPPAPLTLFKGVRKLPVASMMVVEKDRPPAISRYWELPEPDEGAGSEQAWAEELRSRLEAAVVSQMVSDVPIGAFLSGGIDSSSIVGLMSRHSHEPVRTYSIGFDSPGAGSFYNELPWARQVAELFGTRHREILVRPDVVELLPKLLWHMDEPVADSAFVTTYLVSRFAREDVTVILSGVGGDELFGGYRRYLGEYYGQYYRMVPRSIRRGLLAPLARRLPADRHSALLNYSRLARNFMLSSDLPFEERYRSYVGVFNDTILDELMLERPGQRRHDALGAAFGRSRGRDPLRTLFDVDLETQMADDLLLLTDKMTMAASLECRVPLLDHGLVEMAARMPSALKIRGRQLKAIMKTALADLLPHEILHRKKRGFGAPMGAWIKTELAPLTHHLLSPQAVRARGLLRPETVSRTLALHEANREDYTDHLLSLINLELWCRLYLDGTSPDDLTASIQAEIPA